MRELDLSMRAKDLSQTTNQPFNKRNQIQKTKINLNKNL